MLRELKPLIFLFLFSFTTALAMMALAQDTTSLYYTGKVYYPVNVVKTNPLAVIWSQIRYTGELRAMYERAFPKRHGAFAAVSYVIPSVLIKQPLKEIADTTDILVKVRGYRLQAGYKYYLTKYRSPKGFYIAPHLSYNSTTFWDANKIGDFLRAEYFSLNALTGFQFVIGGNFALDIFTGLGYKSNTISRNLERTTFAKLNGALSKDATHLKVSFGVNFGYAF